MLLSKIWHSLLHRNKPRNCLGMDAVLPENNVPIAATAFFSALSAEACRLQGIWGVAKSSHVGLKSALSMVGKISSLIYFI